MTHTNPYDTRYDSRDEEPTPDTPEPLEEESRREEALADDDVTATADERDDVHDGPGPVYAPDADTVFPLTGEEPVDPAHPREEADASDRLSDPVDSTDDVRDRDDLDPVAAPSGNEGDVLVSAESQTTDFGDRDGDDDERDFEPVAAETDHVAETDRVADPDQVAAEDVSPETPAFEPVAAAYADDVAERGEPVEGVEGVPTSGTEESVAVAEEVEFDRRWHEIKAGFVDDPRDSVEQADTLLEEAVAVFTSRRQSLVDRWKNTSQHDTEQLRLTLREYRALLDQLTGK